VRYIRNQDFEPARHRIQEWERRRGGDLSTREPRGGGQWPSLPHVESGGRRLSLLHIVAKPQVAGCSAA